MKEEWFPKPFLYDNQHQHMTHGLQYYGRALRQPMTNDDMVNPWAIVRSHGE